MDHCQSISLSFSFSLLSSNSIQNISASLLFSPSPFSPTVPPFFNSWLPQRLQICVSHLMEAFTIHLLFPSVALPSSVCAPVCAPSLCPRFVRLCFCSPRLVRPLRLPNFYFPGVRVGMTFWHKSYVSLQKNGRGWHKSFLRVRLRC
jgi:hypothetical protein